MFNMCKKNFSVFILSCTVLFLVHCTKKSGANKEAPKTGTITVEDTSTDTLTNTNVQLGVTPASGDVIVMTGQLALGTNLTDTAIPDKVVALPLYNNALAAYGDLSNLKEIKTVAIDANGVFSMELPAEDSLSKLKACENSDGTIDLEKVKNVLSADDMAQLGIDSMTAEELKQVWPDLLSEIENHLGDQTWVLASAVSNEDRYTEATSFSFIGLPIGGNNFINIPPLKAKGNIGLGQVGLSGDDASAELPASSEVFTFSDAALSEIAKTNAALKSIKNGYANSDAEATYTYSSQIWFWFKDKFVDGNGKSINNIKNQFSVPTNLEYTGYSAVVQPGGTAEQLSAESLCDPTDSNYHTLEMAPPVGTTVAINKTGGTVFEDAPGKRASNANMGPLNTSASSGSTVKSCMNYGSSGQTQAMNISKFTGPTARNNYSIWEWGTSDGFTGEIPLGYWTLYFDNIAVAHFDFSSANPIDANGKPKIYMPDLKLTVDGAEKITKIEIRFNNLWDAEKGFEPLTSLEALNSVVKSVRVSLSGTDLMANDLSMKANDNLIFELEEPTIKDWYFYGTTAPTGGDCANSNGCVTANGIGIWFEMYGNQYSMQWN